MFIAFVIQGSMRLHVRKRSTSINAPRPNSVEMRNSVTLILGYDSSKSFWNGVGRQEILADARLNLLALEYGYKYRLDIEPRNTSSRTEFVRTLREARYIGMPIRRSSGTVQFFKIHGDGTLTRHQW